MMRTWHTIACLLFHLKTNSPFHQFNSSTLNMDANSKPVVQHHTLGRAHAALSKRKQNYSNISEHLSCNATLPGCVWAQGDEAVSKGERTMTKQWHRRARRTTCTVKPCTIIKTDMQQKSYSPRNVLNTNKHARLLSWKHRATLQCKEDGE